MSHPISQPQPNPILLGLERHIAALYPHLQGADRARAVCLSGVSGIGKTTLAQALAERFAAEHGKESVLRLWHDPQGGLAIRNEANLSLDADGRLPDALRSRLADPARLVLLDGHNRAGSAGVLWQKISAATAGTALCALDGLSVTDCGMQYEVNELSHTEAAALIMLLLARRGYNLTLPVGFLERIYQAVGGLPLALRLIAGQVGRLSNERMLSGLLESKLTSPESFYNVMLWRSWEALSADAQQLMIELLPLAFNAAPQRAGERAQIPPKRGEQAWLEAQSLNLLEPGEDRLHPAVWKFVYFRSLDS